MSDMRRREFIALLSGAAAAWPLGAGAAANQITRIGYLSQESAAFDRSHGDSAAFRSALRDPGYVEGRNLHIEFRYAEADLDRLPALAAELVALNVDIIVTYSVGTFAARRVTTTIPIVQAVGSDIVAAGFAGSLAHLGGNVTGSTFFLSELMAKRLELLKEIRPSMTRAGVLMVRNHPSTPGILEAMGSTAQALNVGVQPIEVSEPGEFDGALSAWVDQRTDGFVMQDHGLMLANVDAIVALAVRHRLLSIGPLELSASGGLFGYGMKFSDFFRRAAYFVDKILNGIKPGDIPIERAAKFNSAVNLKTAKALGIDMPTSILLRADEVIE
jgi:putative tryptophan/tyrosine transport system substrate-binding protein